MFRFPFYGYPYNYYRYYNQIPQNNISNFEKEAHKNILEEKINEDNTENKEKVVLLILEILVILLINLFLRF